MPLNTRFGLSPLSPQFLAHQLAQELMISEATLGRHLAGLKQILSEFDLSIQNGRWRGPEHQIRYFYFCLFRKVWSSQEWERSNAKERTQDITTLRRNLRCKLVFRPEIGLGSSGLILVNNVSGSMPVSFKSIEEKNAGVF